MYVEHSEWHHFGTVFEKGPQSIYAHHLPAVAHQRPEADGNVAGIGVVVCREAAVGQPLSSR